MKGRKMKIHHAPQTHIISFRAGIVRHIVMNLDGAGDDVGLGLVHGGGHFRRDKGLVVVIKRVSHAVFLDAQRNDAGVNLSSLASL